MPWDPSNNRLTAPLNIAGRGDVQRALKTLDPSLGGAIRRGTINKWAKWKPLRSTSKELKSETARKYAGTSGYLYGVKGTAGVRTSIAGLHGTTFDYEGPESWTAGCLDRFTDFIHPDVPQAYGYRADAYIDLSAEVGWTGETPNTVVLDAEPEFGSFTVTVNYNPHNDAKRQEMLSIKDFMVNSVTEYDPTDFYPCVLIGTMLHCLHPDGGPYQPTKLTQGTTYWRLSVPGTLFTAGTSSTLSVILVRCNSGTHISPGPDTDYDLSNWIQLGSDRGDDSDRVWAAWFTGVPEGCGIPVSFVGDPYGIPSYTVTDADVNNDGTGILVVGEWSHGYGYETTTSVSVQIYKTGNAPFSATKSRAAMASIDTSRPHPGLIFYWSDFGDSQGGEFIRNAMAETYNIEAFATVTASAHPYTPSTGDYYRDTIEIPGSSSSSGGGQSEILQ